MTTRHPLQAITEVLNLTIPLSKKVLKGLRAGDKISFNGSLLTARDLAHQRIVSLVRDKEKLPVSFDGKVVYYASPTPTKAGQPIGSIGPSSSYRMDNFTNVLLELGVLGFIGKGPRNPEVIHNLRQKNAIYFVTWGGLGALLAQYVKKASVVAFEDLGPEAIYSLEVENFPALVVNDLEGEDFYRLGPSRFKKY